MSKAIYEKWRTLRDQENELMKEIKQEFEKITVGPSGFEGIYITKVDNQGAKHQVSNINKEEAQFLIEYLTNIYDL